MAYRHPQDRQRDVERAQQLRAEGLNVSGVALAMGIGRSTASDLLNYPDQGELYKKRRRSFAICPGCGGKMSHGATRCRKCRKDQGWHTPPSST